MKTKLCIWSMALMTLALVGCEGGGNNPENPSNVDENGALRGKFSISGNKQIQFSCGNLQYQASTNTWRFAEHQWDAVGKGNKNISPTYDGWIDLFGWGTGSNPTLTSSLTHDYLVFTDWGKNKISNGGNENYLWRTMTKEEWEYLLFNRPYAENLRAPAFVNNVVGYIILPDKWSLPKGVSFVATADEWGMNTYEPSAWQKMEAAGAVFLPACGFRGGTNLLGGGCHYASSTMSTESDVKCYEAFLTQNKAEVCLGYRYYATSVRLIKVQ